MAIRQRAKRGSSQISEKRDGLGRSRFYCRITDLDGKRKHRRLNATTPAEAMAELADILNRIDKGKQGIIEPTQEEKKAAQDAATLTVAQLVAKFCESYTSAKVKDIKTYRAEAKRVLTVRVVETLGTRIASTLTDSDMEDLIAKLVGALEWPTRSSRPPIAVTIPSRTPRWEGLTDRDRHSRVLGDDYAGSSVRAALAATSRMFVWARKRKLVTCENPVRDIERPPVAESLEFLSRAEAEKLLGHLEKDRPELFPLIAFALMTGARKGECLGLRWQDVHFDASRIDIARSYGTAPKSGKGRHVPLSPELARVLRQWRDSRPISPTGLVFPVEGRMGRREEVLGLGEIYDDAEVKRPTKPWHALRHTYASHFVMAGGSILALRAILGHGDVKMTMRYAHLAGDFLQAEATRVSFTPTVADVVSLDEHRATIGHG